MSQAPAVTIHVPFALRECCGGNADLNLSANSVRAVFDQLREQQPKLYSSICDETHTLRRHMNLFVNSSLLRWPEALDQELAAGDVVSIMTAVSGG